LESAGGGRYRIPERVKSQVEPIKPHLKKFRGDLLRPTKVQLKPTKDLIAEILRAESPILIEDNLIVEQRLRDWINADLGWPPDTPLDWEAIDQFNRRFITASPEEQNARVAAFWEILKDQVAQQRPKVLQEELSDVRPSVSDVPPILAVAIPNTLVFALRLKETREGLRIVDSDLMSAGKTFAAGQALVGFGRQVRLVTFVGQGSVGQRFEEFAYQVGFDTLMPIETDGDTRFAPNILRENDAFEWHFSAPGPSFSGTEIKALHDAADELYSNTAPGTIVIMGGKAPPGSDVSFWVDAVQHAKSHGLRVFFDSLDKKGSTEDLQRILASGVELIKPNLDEFANLVGKDRSVFEDNPEAIVREAQQLIDSINARGGNLEFVVVSLAEKGAILITPNEAYFAIAPTITPRNTLGAGDAMVGALAHQLSLNRPLEETIRFSVAVATISTQKPGVVRTATLEEAEELASKIWVRSIEPGKDAETWYASGLPQDTFEFEKRALDIALQFFESYADVSKLERTLLEIEGVQSVLWDNGVLSILSDTEVVKLHIRQLEINERLGLKDRFYIGSHRGYSDDITVKIYSRDRRDSLEQSGPVYVLGVGRNSHDQGAVLIKDGVVVGAIEEERLVQDKHTRAYFPVESVRYLLDAHGLTWEDINHIAVTYDYNFFRDTPHSSALYGRFCAAHGVSGLASEAEGRYDTDYLQSFLEEMAIEYGTGYVPSVTFVKHHKAHAAAAWYSSGFPEPTLVVINDGRGEDESTSIWLADQGSLTKISSTPYTHSLGHFYHIVTKYLGYRSHDEGKVMGFAPYGSPRDTQEEERVERLRVLMRDLVQFDPQTGQIQMAQEYLNFGTITSFPEVNFSEEFLEILGEIVPPFPVGMGRTLDPEKTEHRPYTNLAYALQERIEEVLIEMVKFYMREHPKTQGIRHVVMAGGLSLNITANGRLVRNGIVDADKFFVPAFPADDGAPVGAAQSVACEEHGLDTRVRIERVSQGRTYSDEEIQSVLDRFGLVEGEDYVRVQDDNELVTSVADALTSGQTVAWFQGGSELGPRALGNRSILHRLDDPQGNLRVNRIKNREPWRPSALSIQEEQAGEFLEGVDTSPFMTIGFPVTQHKKDIIKAGVHPADGTTRPQTVSHEANFIYWTLLGEMGRRTGVPGVLNTSFNRWGPIVETPEEALNTLYYGDGIDQLAIGHFIVRRTQRLVPSVLNPRDEPSLSDRFVQSRYVSEPFTQTWDSFWEVASDLVESRNVSHQHYVVVHVATAAGDKEILRVPLCKDMFQRGPREKIIADLAHRIQQRLGSDTRVTIAIGTTAGEYTDTVARLFEQFAPPEIRARWNIVKLNYNTQHDPRVSQQRELEYSEAIVHLSERVQSLQVEQRATPVLIGIAGPTASGRAMFSNQVSGTHCVIDAQRWTIPESERDDNLQFPFSQIRFNDFVGSLERLHRGETSMIPCCFPDQGRAITLDLSRMSDVPQSGFAVVPEHIAQEYRHFMAKKNSQLWVRVSDGMLFEQVKPEEGDVFLVSASFALSYPGLRSLFEESYFVATSEEMHELSLLREMDRGESETTPIPRIPVGLQGYEFATCLVSTSERDLRGDQVYPNPLLPLEDPVILDFVRDILVDRYTQYDLPEELVDKILEYALANRLDPELACEEIYRHVVDFVSGDRDAPFHRIYFGSYKRDVKPQLLRSLVEGRVKGPVVVDMGAGMSALALGLLEGNPEIERFISTHNIDYSRVTIDDPRMEFVLEETEEGFRVPIEDCSVHTVIVTGRLHHLYRGREAELFREINRILHPEGTILIIEDAWSDELPDPRGDQFSERLRELTPAQRQATMAFLDWVGTRLLPGPVPMARPWNFKSIEEWSRDIFQPSGLTALSQEYHGFPVRKFTPLALSTVELVKTHPEVEKVVAKLDSGGSFLDEGHVRPVLLDCRTVFSERNINLVTVNEFYQSNIVGLESNDIPVVVVNIPYAQAEKLKTYFGNRAVILNLYNSSLYNYFDRLLEGREILLLDDPNELDDLRRHLDQA